MFEKKNRYCVNNAASTDPVISATEEQKKETSRRFCGVNFSPFLAFFYVFLCSTFILLTSVMVKKLVYISPGQLSMVRNVGVFVGCLPIAVYSSKEVFGPRKYWMLLFGRSFCGATALYLNLLAYRYLPLAEASIIMSTTPALVTVGARVYLKEKCGLIQTGAILLTVIGMLVSIRLPELIRQEGRTDTTTYAIGLCSALGCVFLLSINLVSLRKMTDVHFSVILVYFGLLGTFENAALTASLSEFVPSRCGWDSVQVMLIGIFGFAGHCFLTLAVQAEAAGIVSVLKASTDIVVAMVFQVLFFGLVPDMYNVGGAILVIMSVSIIGTRKYLQTLPEGCSQRKRLRYLLL